MSVKKGLMLVVGIIMVAALAFGICYAFPIFKVNNIEVQGLSQSTAEEVEKATGIERGSNLVRVSPQSAAMGVATLPWVESVSVNTSLPGTVNVSVTEVEARAFVQRSDGDHLIDKDGRAFVIQPAPEGLIKITGTNEDDQKTFQGVITVINALDQKVREQVAEIDVPQRDEITIVSKDGQRIYWGSANNSNDKAVTLGYALDREEPNLDISGAPVIAVKF